MFLFNLSFGQDNDSIYTIVEESPTFPGGDEGRIKFIQENIKYPMEALQNGVQGTVYVTFVVEKDGSLSNIRILKGIGYGCDKEVLRITKLMPKWNLGKQKAEPVRVQFNLPVHFILQG